MDSTPKIFFQDSELEICEDYKKFLLIKNFLKDGYNQIDLHRFQKQTFLDLVEGKYSLKTLSLADFLMAPEEILAKNIIAVSEQCDYRNGEDLDLVRDSEFFKS